ncbi:MAG: hypothetical protein AAFO01_20145, partial [Pseudomonadota bacterium]
ISSEDEAFKDMQLGTVDGFFITANNVSPHWPLMDVTVLPYIFQNAEHLDRVLDGEVGQMMKNPSTVPSCMALNASSSLEIWLQQRSLTSITPSECSATFS